MGLSASPVGSSNTLTQFCVHYSIPGTNIMPNVYMVRVRERVVAADVEKNEYLYASETTITVTNSSGAGQRREPCKQTKRATGGPVSTFGQNKGITSAPDARSVYEQACLVFITTPM